mmetsp:Transcript_9515/g.15902  ORF Transcript_9515/g.15902 Transcript_9515/m.15902 type:complete len:244 (+) Transcript_9515:1044-1775(+)
MMSPFSSTARLNSSTSSMSFPYIAMVASGMAFCRFRRRLLLVMALSSRAMITNPGGSGQVAGCRDCNGVRAEDGALVLKVSSKNTSSPSCHSSATMLAALATMRIWPRPSPSDNTGGEELFGSGASGCCVDQRRSAGRLGSARFTMRKRTVKSFGFSGDVSIMVWVEHVEASGSSSDIRTVSFTSGSVGQPCRVALVTALSKMTLHTMGSRHAIWEGQSSATSRPFTKSSANCRRLVSRGCTL